MRVNFYFLYPNEFMGKESWHCVDDENMTCRHDGYNMGNWFMQPAMMHLYRSLKKKYPEIEINAVNIWDKANIPCCCNKYNIFIPILENPDNGKHMIISYCDKNMWIRKENDWPDLDNCVQMFAIGGIHVDDITYNYYDPRIEYTPGVLHTHHYIAYLKMQHYNGSFNIPLFDKPYEEKIIPEKPVFVGGGRWNFRKHISENDDRFVFKEPILPADFVDEMNKYAVHICLNGGAEVSNRTFDAFGMGAALVRPALKIQFHNKLIPGHHYAEVPCDDFTDYKALADAYIDTFEKVKKDDDYRNFLIENGKKYWQENCTIESFVKIYTDLIDLYKLK